MASETSRHEALVVHSYDEEREHTLSPVFQVPDRHAEKLREVVMGINGVEGKTTPWRVTYLCRGFYNLFSGLGGGIVGEDGHAGEAGAVKIVGNQIWTNEPRTNLIESALKKSQIPYRQQSHRVDWASNEPVKLRERD